MCVREYKGARGRAAALKRVRIFPSVRQRHRSGVVSAAMRIRTRLGGTLIGMRNIRCVCVCVRSECVWLAPVRVDSAFDVAVFGHVCA